jgi:sulfofructose kinase
MVGHLYDRRPRAKASLDREAMAKVVCVGISVFDYVFRVERLPEAHIKYYALGRLDVSGGIAANAARAVARLGGEAVLVSRVGDDLPGRGVRDELARERIDLTGLHTLAGARTSLSAVIIDPSGERMLVNDTDPRTLQGVEGVAPELFAGADVVLADTRWADGARAAVHAARDLGVPSVLDFDRAPDHGGAEELLAHASHIVFGRQGLAQLAGDEDPARGLRHARELSPAWLAVTSSAEGVYWLDGDRVRHEPAFAVETVDTLGAGDIFHAAFALALAEGRDERAALRFANAAAALKCTRPGGGAGAPWRHEVETFLKERM